MMYGTRELFEYDECAACGSVQLAYVPDDLGAYYPRDYYSYDQAPLGLWKRIRQGLRNRAILFAPTLLSDWAAGRKSDRTMSLLRAAGIGQDSRVLDVGCGGGALLRALARAGLKRLAGADPFIQADFSTPEGVPIRRHSIREAEGVFDIVMFNHSLEHTPDMATDLRAALTRLSAGGCCMVRIPVMGTYAARKYGPAWYAFDPPRHVALPTVEGMRRLAERTGFALERTIFDSGPMQFIASELYARDIPLSEAHAHPFSDVDVAAFKRLADDLNARADGDQAAFFFRPA
jgi:SAM-dependent methyltransferase